MGFIQKSVKVNLGQRMALHFFYHNPLFLCEYLFDFPLYCTTKCK